MQTPNSLEELIAVQKRIDNLERSISVIRYKSNLVRGKYNRTNKPASLREGKRVVLEVKLITDELEGLRHYLDPMSVSYYYHLIDDEGEVYSGKRYSSFLGACSSRNKLVRQLLEVGSLEVGGLQACRLNPRDFVTTVGDYREWGIYEKRINRK